MSDVGSALSNSTKWSIKHSTSTISCEAWARCKSEWSVSLCRAHGQPYLISIPLSLGNNPPPSPHLIRLLAGRKGVGSCQRLSVLSKGWIFSSDSVTVLAEPWLLRPRCTQLIKEQNKDGRAPWKPWRTTQRWMGTLEMKASIPSILAWPHYTCVCHMRWHHYWNTHTSIGRLQTDGWEGIVLAPELCLL